LYPDTAVSQGCEKAEFTFSAGKNKADVSSFLAAFFECIDIIRMKKLNSHNPDTCWQSK
jgi:hypothetical protein